MTKGTAKEKSDIDFLIIAKAGRIWTTRFLVTAFVHLTGKRRYGNKIAGRICLNRYQTDKSLEIFPHDIYHAGVFSALAPIFNVGSTYSEYRKANEWTERDFNLRIENKSGKVSIKGSKILAFKRRSLEWMLKGRFGDWVEKKLSNWQRKRIIKDIRTHTAPPGRVRISDKELCFHPDDKK